MKACFRALAHVCVVFATDRIGGKTAARALFRPTLKQVAIAQVKSSRVWTIVTGGRP